MVGMGPGARSYTTALHYSSDYAVGRAGILDIIANYNRRTGEQFAQADYGCELDAQEQRRRYVLKSLLRSDGLDLSAYASFFGTEAFAEFQQLGELLEDELAVESGRYLRLTMEGMELSDVIGPWLWSANVRERMNDFALR